MPRPVVEAMIAKNTMHSEAPTWVLLLGFAPFCDAVVGCVLSGVEDVTDSVVVVEVVVVGASQQRLNCNNYLGCNTLYMHI